MENPEDPEEQQSPPTRRQPSKTPSWVMLGFILGAVFVWLLPRQEPEPVAPAIEAPKTPTTASSTPLRLLLIEALFDRWGEYADWEGDRTEIAAWNAETLDYTDFFEVRRVWINEAGLYLYYFRTILGFSRPVKAHDVPADSLLRFTESASENAQWLKSQRDSQLRRAFGVGSSNAQPTPDLPGPPKAEASQVTPLPIPEP